MKLEEMETKQLLTYTPTDPESMRQALSEYTELIRSGKAFRNSYCTAHFRTNDIKVPLTYFEKEPSLISYLETTSYYFHKGSDCEDLQSATTGEALFFLCTMMYPELEQDVRKACEAIVAFARETNDSSEMWLTCEHPFGIEPLHITAVKYPQYGYLLAAFLIPHWDEEHMGEALHALASWAHRIGINDDTLKAFCYCDNSTARAYMLGFDPWDGEAPGKSPFDLLTHFRNSPGEYVKFKDILYQRFEASPLISYGDMDINPDQPLSEIIGQILLVHHDFDPLDEEFDWDEFLVHPFLTTQADEEILALTQEIEIRLGYALTVSLEEEEISFEEGEEEKTEEWSEIRKWRQLITRVFSGGDELWDYVETGKNPSVLDRVEAIDLVEAAQGNECVLAEYFEEECYGVPLREEIYSILTPLIDELMEDIPREERGPRKRFFSGSLTSFTGPWAVPPCTPEQ